MDTPILVLDGEVVSIGDLPAADAPQIVGVPHVGIRLAGGRLVLVSGLTLDECLACAKAFMSPTQLVIRV